MRIVCPSCNAQYEIDISLLPDEGREVQCSACGNIWFQEGVLPQKADQPEYDGPPAAPAAQKLGGGSDGVDATQTRQQGPVTAPPPLATDHSSNVIEEDTVQDMPEPHPTPRPDHQPEMRQPKPVDPKVLDILRDEAAYEAQQRARDAHGLETQPELGLLGAAPWPSKSEARSEPAPAQGADPKSGSSSSAFLDIDDISASLEPIGRARGRSGDKNSDFEVPATSEEKKRSFLRGLILPLVLALVLIALYLAAPLIIGAVPATAPALLGYVNAVDGVRGAIVGLLGN